MRKAVAISTTGDEHRLGFLETCVEAWDKALSPGDSLFVTVDGNAEDTRRAAERVHFWTESVFQVGQGPDEGVRRHGVAVNKNTGLELMMDNTRADHLFLSDDDTWPLFSASLDKHTGTPLTHSMVCWGKSRALAPVDEAAVWSWPRGVMLYTQRRVIETIGGMDERFGPGGHEHAEFSQRIHNAGFTPAPFCSPLSYMTRNYQGARALWHCEDMARPGELLADLGIRRKKNTSVRRGPGDWEKINAVMLEREGSSDYVGFRARENGRAWATLCSNLTSRGAEGQA